MAWRIDQSLVRGEIDSRVRGRVTGRLWLLGRAEPIELDLTGEPRSDLAGHRLTFVNPQPRAGDPVDLASLQVGRVGDVTASRKVKVPNGWGQGVRSLEHPAQRGWHWANTLYVEWFSRTNGRIVIESPSYELSIDSEPVWRRSPAEEDGRRLSTSDAREDSGEASLDDEWNEEPPHIIQLPSWADAAEQERPMTEEEAERLQAESDKLNDRVHERMEREGPDADLGRIIEEEIERARRERGEPDPTPEERAEQRRWIDEMNAAADELAGGDLTEADEDEFPLAIRARELSLRVLTDADLQGWVPKGASREHPLVELQTAVMKAGGKLAGALAGRQWPPPRDACASTIVWLKRAATYLHEAHLAVEACAADRLATLEWLGEVDREIAWLIAQATTLIEELRQRLADEVE